MTEQEKSELKQEILTAIKCESQDVAELATVGSLDGVNSLPAMKGRELVTVPISLLSKPAVDAAAEAVLAKSNAEAATTAADTAAQIANTAATTANAAATAANAAKTKADSATAAAYQVVGEYQDVAVNARNGATARFNGIIDNVTLVESEFINPSAVYYIRKKKVFAAYHNGEYSNSWHGSQFMYNDPNGITLQKNKLFLLEDTLYAWSEEENDLVEVSGAGGGNVINVPATYPQEGFYTLLTATQAVEEKRRAKGVCITFEEAHGKWVTKQFIGTDLSTWEYLSGWEDFGGGTVKSITLNGNKRYPDAGGDVAMTFDKVNVDETLDAESTNAVQNRAVAAKMSEIEAGTVFSMDAEVSDDQSNVTLTLRNKSNAAIASVAIPAGGGGGTETTTTKVVLTSSVNHNIIKEGANCQLTWTYDHQYVGGDDSGSTTGQKATVEIRLMRGAIQAYFEEKKEVSRGTYTLDLSKYLQLGTTDVYVKATATDPTTGKTQTKQAYLNIRVLNLSLQSSYNLANGIVNGGYASNDTAVVPYTVQGTGTKVITLYVDGVQYNSATVTRSGTTNGSFSIPIHSLTAGRHTLQMVAEMEASPELTLSSESIYADFYKAGSATRIIGTKHTFKSGRIFTENHLTPIVEAGQYEQLSFEYAVFDANKTPADMGVWLNGSEVQKVSIPRTVQTYTNRFTEQGVQPMKFVCGAVEYPFSVDVQKSSIDIQEATLGLQLKLNAAGRSNGEADPAHWEHGSTRTTFSHFDWSTSGWNGDALKLMNGASAVVDYKPFAADASALGRTIEVEMKVSNITDKEANVVSCMDGTMGFQITADKAMMYTGSTKEVFDEDGQKTTQKVGVGRQYGADMWVKIAFVISKRDGGSMMELYVNGTRSAADIYAESDNFVQANAKGISIESAGADVEVRIIRVYDRALSDDEVIDNYIVDRRNLDEMARFFEENDVLGDDGRSISFEKLRKKGKGIMLVVRPEGLAPVNVENNKKTDFLSDVHFWLPDGRYIKFANINIRIQGTSSTKYPTKNYRIYCSKGRLPEMYLNGEKKSDLKMALREGQKNVKILCAKADYSDSSMAQNTGGAKIYNDLMKSLGFLTPPQKVDPSVRVSVDGYPIDVFSSQSMDETPVYYGQYNLNHDKSDWQDIIGLSGVAGFTPSQPMAFEFLNNTQPLCLFQAQADLDAQAAEDFDNALEFNYPKDVTWTTATEAQKTAFKRLWGWIRDCVPSGATPADVKTFVSAKFKSEVSQYINKDFLLAWWLFTDYFSMVDQRAKNMIWATWDALVWYMLYYDGDTQLGDRNDSMLAYLYDVTRDTWDAEKSKYAFEGHDSHLWCLVLANFEAEIKEMATKMRSKLSVAQVNKVFDEEQQSNWSGRAFNKSGRIKYIIPQIEGVQTKDGLVKYPYIYALKGDKKSFRHWFINNRFSLLDAKYETGNFLSDNIDLYMSRTAAAAANTMVLTASELYYFGYGTNNAPHLQASQRAEKGGKVTLTFKSAFTVNDPIRVYGASRIAELDARGAANNLTGDINLNKCRVLRKLDLSTSGSGSMGWCLVLDQCRQLAEVNLYGQANAKTGTLSSTVLDFTRQTRLTTLDARGANVNAVLFAKGSPVATAKLGSTIQTLRLEYLPELTMSGLTLQNWSSVKTLRLAGCPHLDWKTIASQCTNLDRIRIEGIDLEDDGTLLHKYKGLKGVDAGGNAVDYCALVGKIQLTRFVEEEEMTALRAYFPELEIKNVQYTLISFDDTVEDGENISNEDNKTGYAYGNDYVPSGHVSNILNRRHTVLGKYQGNKKMKVCLLDDNNRNYYHDGTEANLKGDRDSTKQDEGDVYVYEPHYWYKGVNDYINDKKYQAFSSVAKTPEDAGSRSEKVNLSTLEKWDRQALSISGLQTGSNVEDNIKTYNIYNVYKVSVKDAKMMRWPGIASGIYGSAYADKDGKCLKVVKLTANNGYQNGDYLFAKVPKNAVWLYFTAPKDIDINLYPDWCVRCFSEEIVAVEPDWVEHVPCLTGAYEANYQNDVLRSISGSNATNNYQAGQYQDFGIARGYGFQCVDYEMSKDVANLFYAKYGTRDSQKQCGYGTGTTGYVCGKTDILGMRDTVNPNNASSHGFYYDTKTKAYVDVTSVNVMGYENWQGDSSEWMSRVGIGNGKYVTDNLGKNRQTKYGVWQITTYDGSVREVQGVRESDKYIIRVRNGRFCDVIATFLGGTSSTSYSDYQWYDDAASRVVARSFSNASAYGGVAFANGVNAASVAVANYGSRLAFRGEIEFVECVEEYKALGMVT